jgi:hypothetical protein
MLETFKCPHCGALYEVTYKKTVSADKAAANCQVCGKQMESMNLLLVKQGRHRYYRLAGSHVRQMLESIMNVALAGPPRFQPRSKLDEKLRYARTCYDHIAGLLGVGLAERLAKREFVILGDEAGEVTPAGADFLSKLGVDLSGARAKRRVSACFSHSSTRESSISR